MKKKEKTEKKEMEEKEEELELNEKEMEEKEEELEIKEKETSETISNIEKEKLSRENIETFQQPVYKQINKISFGVLSPKVIKKMAAAKIVTPELYDKEGYPVDGGLMDVRLGVIDPGLRCKSCGGKLKECVGHFGYIELARPIIHVKFVKIIQLLLRSFCRDCGRILIPQEKISKYKTYLEKIEKEHGIEKRWLAAKNIIDRLKTTSKCPHCNTKQLKITLEKPTTFIEGEKRISPVEIRARFENILDDDCMIFGINPQTARPEWSILTVLSIPPVTVRPSITLESGERSEDDLTHKLGDIVRINQRLFENINAGAPEIIVEDLWDLLQYHITTFFDNSISQLPPARHRSGQPLKTITERIKSKEGRIRHNLAGKRTNFCARTVISPDPMLGINEVGVPLIMAKKLTIPETVNDWNIAYLKSFIEKGPSTYPGANYVIRPDGKKKKITEETKEALLEEIQPGYIIERHLLNGDIALFNRQPSLHRMSMMSHRVRVLPGKTLRINPAVCNPYNADFDGDEMNLHIPQTEEARAEAEILMDVQTQIISPRYGLSVIGCIQDAISGNYLLTKSGKMSREDAIQLLCSVGLTDFSKVPNKKEITGSEIFSCLIPEDCNYSGKTKSGDDIIIENGKIKKGWIDSKSIGGEGEGLLLRTLHKNYGSEKTIKLLHQIEKLGAEYLMILGLSSGLSDEDLPEPIKEEINKTLFEAEEEVKELIEKYKNRSLEILPGRTASETLELRVLERLNKARNNIGQIVKQQVDEKTNQTVSMILSGARGNILNIVQMASCVGQQALRGKRIEKGYAKRTLSCFKKGDLGTEAHGFISRGFKQGLKPFELFFISMTGRDALMDTALRTPKSGYLYRRLANTLQDLRVEYDGTVRDANGRIIQFKYGEDGIDVSKSENGIINVERINKSA
jgi:DNA-directed RNA polymerase subunit A'